MDNWPKQTVDWLGLVYIVSNLSRFWRQNLVKQRSGVKRDLMMMLPATHALIDNQMSRELLFFYHLLGWFEWKKAKEIRL